MKALIVMAILIVVGIFEIWNPRFFWEWQYRHAEKAGDPPRWYLIGMRISGGIMCIIGLGILFWLLFA